MPTRVRMKGLTVLSHPLVLHDMAVMRDRTTDARTFREAARRLSRMLAIEAGRHLTTRPRVVRTPLETTTGARLARRVVLVPVLRAGLGMVDGFLDVYPDASTGHIGLYRDEATLLPVDYYSRLPGRLGSSTVFLLDPMVATGGSASAAIGHLKRSGARRVVVACLIAAPQGVREVLREHPDSTILSTALDRALNRQGYILPGLGDAGDRFFGTGKTR